MRRTTVGQERAWSVEWRLGGGAIAMIAVSYGFARYGYGLFEPQLREEFALSLAGSGQIASGAYVGYVIALFVVGVSVDRVGPRPLVTAAGVSAAVGTALVVVAEQPWQLFVGLLVAGASSGFVWAPYSDAIAQLVAPARRDVVLAAIPSGTAFGIAVAGGLALSLGGTTWRLAWIVFSAAGVLVTVANVWLLRGTHPVARATSLVSPISSRFYTRVGTRALCVTALSYGAVGAVYWTFAVAVIAQGSTRATSVEAVFWTLIGVAGVAAIWSGRVLARLGLPRSHTVLHAGLAAATALIAAAPGWWPAVGVSAIIFGPVFMALSSLLAVWSYRLFPDRPAAGLNTVVVFLGLGAVLGPAVFGALADLWNLQTALLLAAVLAAAATAARPRVVASATGDDRAPGAAPVAPWPGDSDRADQAGGRDEHG